MSIVGIDEVGRGAWAGPLVVSAVVLGKKVEGLADSKSISKKKRTSLNTAIYSNALYVGLGWVPASEIDRVGLTRAMIVAINRALFDYNHKTEQIIIDGNINYLERLSKSRAIIKADMMVPEVCAASIVAKVARDDYMSGLSKHYPGFGFENNVGYGTREHLKQLNQYGPTPYHRYSFNPIKKYLYGAS